MAVLARVRRALFMGAAGVMFLVLAGATYQGVATALERREFPHPGQLVDVGGHQLHVYCTGEGQPTVVLEAPAAGMSAAWGWVQPAVASLTRVCSYDRSGLGWSEAGDGPYEPSTAVEQLHTLLMASGQRGPYVIVGHGLGAALATVYAGRFGSDLAALVLVDPPAATGERRAQPLRFAGALPWLARAGVLRATGRVSSAAIGLPAHSAGALGAFLNRPDHLTRAAGELNRWDETVRSAAASHLDPALRVVRLEVAGTGPTALLSDAGQAATVSAAITSLVETVRSHP
jgi:pimeloyl-ACP methyl ester carboxylesterase